MARDIDRIVRWYSICMIIVIIILAVSYCSAGETGKSKSFGGVAWDKEGNIVMFDAGIEYVADDAFECLSSTDYRRHNRKIELNVDYKEWKYEKDGAKIKYSNQKEISAKEALVKMSSEERFREAMKLACIPEEEQNRYVLVVERVIYPDIRSKGLTYWYVFVPREYWCPNKKPSSSE